MQGKVCGKKRHTKTEIRSEISELICGRIAAGENYNLTRDSLSLTQYAQYVCEQEIADRGRQYWEKNRNKGAVMHPFTDFFET